jgi:hypothetical protein
MIRFDEPLLAISDHPIVEVPLRAGRRLPEIPSGHGALNVLEVRVPVAPHLAVLMTWKDARDASGVLRGTQEQAENINAFAIAQAERQWMWKPGTTPANGDGPFDPLSPALFPGYSDLSAEVSVLREAVGVRVNAALGEPLTSGPQEVEIVSVD